MYICIYKYVYIYIYTFSLSRKPSGRFLMVSVVDIIQHLFMASFVARNVFFLGFRRWFLFLMVSVVAGKRFCMVSVAGLLVDSAAAGGSTSLECIERFLVCFCVFRTGFRRWFFYGFRRGRKTFCLWFLSSFFYCFPSWQETFLMASVVGLFMVSGCYRAAVVSPIETVKNIRTFP